MKLGSTGKVSHVTVVIRCLCHLRRGKGIVESVSQGALPVWHLQGMLRALHLVRVSKTLSGYAYLKRNYGNYASS